jgi:hypothetical protein
MRFDPKVVDEVYIKIDQLKANYDDVDKETAQINKRETLLGVTKTQFSELRAVQDDLKPLYDLWKLAWRFGKTVKQWVEGRFDLLDAVAIEARVDEWSNELKRLYKTHVIAKYPK